MRKGIKYLGAVLTGACFLAMAACGSGKDGKAEIVGTWELSAGEADGQTISGDELNEALGYSMTIEIKEDGTFEAANTADPDETAEGEWKEEDGKYILEAEDLPLTFTLTDGKLVAEQEGVKLIFEK